MSVTSPNDKEVNALLAQVINLTEAVERNVLILMNEMSPILKEEKDEIFNSVEFKEQNSPMGKELMEVLMSLDNSNCRITELIENLTI